MVNTKLALLLVLLHTAFGSSYRWFNWQFEVTCESDAYIAPHNETAVANFLKQQYPKGSHIKVVGNGYGFGNLTTCVDKSLTQKPSYIVSMTNLKGLNIDKKKMTVIFSTGWDVYDLTEELKANNLSFSNLGVERPTLLLKKTTKVVNATSDYTLMGKQLVQLYKDHDRVTVWGPYFDWNKASQNWDLEPTYFYSYWELTNYTGVRNCTLNYCANGCGDCKTEYICYDKVIDAASCPPQGVCDREFYAEIEHFLPIEYYAEAAADYISYQQSQTPRMKAPYNSIMVIQHRSLKGDDAYMSPVNIYNLGSDLSGVFAIIEIDWIQTYNNFTTLWQN
ncbi:putative gulonolactone oxidase [Aspergillus flavus AF70]|nr:putative gulonolactone oxidase [Aspergillus flavus AF70]